jgi:selenide, water dikinase
VEMMRGSGVSVAIDLEKLPVFGAVAGCLANDILSGAIERNAEYAGAWVLADHPDAKALSVLYDPQTSGGLLVALAPRKAGRFVAGMKKRGHAATSVIGEIIARTGRKAGDGRVFVRNAELRNLIGITDGVLPKARPARAGARRDPS